MSFGFYWRPWRMNAAVGYAPSIVSPSTFDGSLTVYERLAHLRTEFEKLSKSYNEFDSDYSGFVDQLNSAFAELQQLVGTFDDRITTNSDDIMRAEVDMHAYVLRHLDTLREQFDAMFDEYQRDTNTYVFNWTTGHVDTLQKALDNYYDYLRPHAFTAIEFDAYGFVVDEFDAMTHSVGEFETYGKMLFPRTDGLHSHSPYTGKLTRWDHLIYQIHNELRQDDGRTAETDMIVSDIEEMNVETFERI